MSLVIAVLLTFISCLPVAAGAQSHQQEMFSKVLGDGWRLAGMAQARPTFNRTWSQEGNTHFDVASTHLTHTAVMLNLESTSRMLVIRLTTTFEGLTQRDGEVTLGSWGNGFIDSRHPHHLLHEAMASFNVFSRMEEVYLSQPVKGSPHTGQMTPWDDHLLNIPLTITCLRYPSASP